ncbi:type IV conjugative transfer system coupling protein TraD [Thiotrichales bacterium 19S11-10]|nr:type IV conjugative transfer system coupling protein TraD [Thiotrichales bacterium 19S11-10]
MSSHNTKSFIRGGQLFLYKSRMFVQVTKRIGKWAILIYLLLVIGLVCYLTGFDDLRVMGVQVYSNLLNAVGLGKTHIWSSPIDPSISFNAHEIATNVTDRSYALLALERFKLHLMWSLLIGGLLYLIVIQLFMNFFVRVGNKHSKDQHISGTKLANSIKETIRSVSKSSKGISDIKIVNILPIPRYSEFQGFLYHGSTGSGKTQAIMRFLDEIRTSGDAAIIYDKECTLKPFFFNQETDIELNPLSELCANWDIWQECETPIEMGALAMYLMPKAIQGSDPFWVDAARTIFSTVAWEMRVQEDRSIIKLLQILLTTSLDQMREILKGTEGENLVSKDIEKTAISIRAVIATYTKALRFLEGLNLDKSKQPFAIKKWVEEQFRSNSNQKGWLFISSRANVHAEIKPLISAWMGMAMKGIQNLPANNGKRFWVIIDEMASLNRLENFADVAADIRKFGGCIAVGIQSISQLEFIYGRDEATAITDLLNTAVYFRSPKQRVADWVSNDLGEQVIEEVRESQSYGPNAIRDGNTISRQRVTRRTVDTGTIMQLEDLECFVRLVGNHPITRIKSDYVSNRKVLLEKSLIERAINWDAIKVITSQLELIEKNNPKTKKKKTLNNNLDDEEHLSVKIELESVQISEDGVIEI